MKKSILTNFVIIGVFFLVGFFLIYRFPGNFIPENIKFVKIAGVDIKVELALTPMEQARGLAGRKELAANTGMLFIFEKIGQYSFWMKDMNFPLDIIWLAPSDGGDGEDIKVIYIKKNAQPESYLETYGPDDNAKYVLEVAAGFSDKNNLKVGDFVQFTY